LNGLFQWPKEAAGLELQCVGSDQFTSTTNQEESQRCKYYLRAAYEVKELVAD
jgi:hypothetical protein